MTRVGPPVDRLARTPMTEALTKCRTLADAAAHWLTVEDRPTARCVGEVRETSAVATIARRFAGSDRDPTRPLVLLCDGHRDEADMTLAALASGRPTLLAPSTVPAATLQRIRESTRPACVVAASPIARHPDVTPAWSVKDDESDLLSPDRDAPAIGTLTSGSTGEPKVFFRSQGSQLDQAIVRVSQWSISIESDVYGHLGIASFAGSMNTICMSVATGLRIVIGLSRHGEGPALRNALRTHRIGFLSLSPTMLRHLTRSTPDGAGFEGVHTMKLSGEPVRAGDVGEFHRVSAGTSRLRVSWGSAEAGTLASGELEAALATTNGPIPVGRPMPGVEVVAIDESGTRCDPEVAGRLVVRSPNIAVSGDRLSARFRRLELDADHRPWFDTGDRGVLARDGRVVVHGREDGDLKVNGVRVDGPAIERHLASLPGVEEVAIVPLALQSSQALGVAFVPDSTEARDAVSTAVASLGSTERRAVIEGFESLPINASQKTDRRAITGAMEQRVATRRAMAVSKGTTPTESLVADAWQAAFDVARPGPDTSLDDLGVDSIARLRLLLELEHRHGLVLPADSRATSTTVASQARNLVPVTEDPDADPIVTLRTGGSSVACFCPGLGGHAWIFEPLARHLDDDIEAIGLDWSRAASRGSRALDWLADRLERCVGDRPLSLLGYSAGAGVAWALAGEWNRRHRSHPEVVVLDGDPSLEGLRRKTWRGHLDRIVSRLRGRRTAVDPIATRLVELRRDGLEVLSRIRARPAAHPLTLLVTPGNEARRAACWRRMSETVRVERVDRPHLDLVRPPLDDDLVRIVRTTMSGTNRTR